MSKLKKFKQFLKSPKTEKDEKYHPVFMGFIGKKVEKKSNTDIKESDYHKQHKLDLGIKDHYGTSPDYNYKSWHGYDDNYYSKSKYKDKPLPAHPNQQSFELKGPKKGHATSFDTEEKLHKGVNREKLHHELSKHYRLDTKLSHEEKHSMKQYSGCEYGNINKYLYSRGQQTEDYHIDDTKPNHPDVSPYYHSNTYAKQHFDTVRQHIKNLSVACKRYQTPKDMVVQTGVSRSPERSINKDKPSDHIRFHLPAYTSTSINPEIAHGFSKVDHQHPHYHVNVGKDEYGSSVYKKVSPEENEKLGYYAEGYKHVVNIHIPKGAHGLYLGDHSECSHEQEFMLHKNAKVKVDPAPTYDHGSKVVNWHGTLVHDGVKWLEGKKKK